MPILSAGDWIALGALALMLIKELAAALRGRSRRAADEARKDDTVETLRSELDRIAAAMEAQAGQHKAHEIDCARRWGGTEEKVSSLVGAYERLALSGEGLQRQITNLALRLAPQPEAAEGEGAMASARRRR